MSKVKWIIFDVSGVLTKFTFTNSEGYRVGNKFFASKKLEAIYFSDEYRDYMLGKISHVTFINNFIRMNNLDLNVEEFNSLFENDLKPMDGMKELISSLRKNYKIALASNEGEALSKLRIEKSGVSEYISKIIISYKIKELKPSLNFFKKALEILDAKSKECVFIDDDSKNVESARSLGIYSILFKDRAGLLAEIKKLNLV